MIMGLFKSTLMPFKGPKETRGAHICNLEIFLEAFSRPNKQHSKLILVGHRKTSIYKGTIGRDPPMVEK